VAKPVTQRDVLWGYAASALNIGAGLILLPVILRYLPSEDVGLWFVFITLASLAQLLEMGFQPTLARNAAYVYAGAQILIKVGLPSEESCAGQINKELLDTLVAAARRIYQAVAIMAALVLLLAGTYYISTLLTPNQDHTSSLLAWVAFASGYIVNFYYGYINGLLQGRGDVSQANKVVVITRSLLIILGGVAVALGYGMIGLGVASMLTAIVGRFAAHRFFYANYIPSNELIGRELSGSQQALIKVLWHNASRLGAVQLGAFLIQRGNILIASSFLGLAAAASYGMTITVLMALSGIAMVICSIQVPHMSALQAKNDRESLASVYGQIILLSWSVFTVGQLILIVLGDSLLDFIGSKTELLPMWPLALLGFIFLLEMNHSIAATYLTTMNRIPFVYASLISGLGIIALALLSIKQFGVLGLIAAQGLVQLAYNNWRWPSEAIFHLEKPLQSILNLGLRRITNGK